MGIKQMQGTSAYIEYIGPRGRKRKKDCIYNKHNKCNNKKCQIYLFNCIGRMYCTKYDDTKEEETNLNNYGNSVRYEKKHKKYEDKINGNKRDINSLKRKSLLNKKVKLLDVEENEIINITIVEENQEDIFSDKISIESPLGKALCGVSVGSEFEIVQGNNIIKYLLKAIK